MYAFTPVDSYQDFNGRLSNTVTTDFITVDEYVIPTLNIINVDVRNFLYDYDSLIHIENDNVIFHNDQPLLLGNTNAGANILINNSTFMDSSFCHGMIDYQYP